MVNINKLKGKIVENGLTVEELADKISVDRSTLYRKMKNEGRRLTIGDADAISKALNLTYKDVNDIFFSQFVA